MQYFTRILSYWYWNDFTVHYHQSCEQDLCSCILLSFVSKITVNWYQVIKVV